MVALEMPPQVQAAYKKCGWLISPQKSRLAWMARCPCNSHVSVPLGYDQTTSGYATADAGLGALWISCLSPRGPRHAYGLGWDDTSLGVRILVGAV